MAEVDMRHLLSNEQGHVCYLDSTPYPRENPGFPFRIGISENAGIMNLPRPINICIDEFIGMIYHCLHDNAVIAFSVIKVTIVF